MIMASKRKIVAQLLKQLGISGSFSRMTRCDAGGNNLVYSLETDAGRMVVKWYFSSPADDRDRLDAEWSFSTYASDVAPCCIPRPIAWDRDHGVALYDYIEGRGITPDEIGETEVMSAINFIRLLNAKAHCGAAVHLPTASEACFSLDGHFKVLDFRLGRLTKATSGNGPGEDGDTARAVRGLCHDISDCWSRIRDRIVEEAGSLRLSLDENLSESDRCLSPSDFGFHNALRRPDGSIVFIDFEYAGWDDPAKMAADFFFQPRVPVAERWYERFLLAATEHVMDRDFQKRRARMLRPMFGLKWCCILLNAFVPEWVARQKFANPELDEALYKDTHLATARGALHDIRDTYRL